MSAGLTFQLILAFLAHGPPARAPVELTWQAPPGCPSAEDVLGEIDHLEGTSAPSAQRLKAVVHLHRDGDGWSARLETFSDGFSGERTYSAGECGQLAQATALIIALALHPGAAVDQVVPAPAHLLSFELGLLATGDVGSLALPSLGGGVDARLEVASFALEVFVLRTLVQGVLRGPRPDSALELQGLVGVGARGCWRALDGRVTVGPCVGVDAWLLEGRESNVTVPSSGAGWWLGPVAGVDLGVRLFGALRLWLAVELGVPLVKPVFEVTGYGTVHQPSAAAGRLRLGVEWRVW